MGNESQISFIFYFKLDWEVSKVDNMCHLISLDDVNVLWDFNCELSCMQTALGEEIFSFFGVVSCVTNNSSFSFLLIFFSNDYELIEALQHDKCHVHKMRSSDELTVVSSSLFKVLSPKSNSWFHLHVWLLRVKYEFWKWKSSLNSSVE